MHVENCRCIMGPALPYVLAACLSEDHERYLLRQLYLQGPGSDGTSNVVCSTLVNVTRRDVFRAVSMVSQNHEVEICSACSGRNLLDRATTVRFNTVHMEGTTVLMVSGRRRAQVNWVIG